MMELSEFDNLTYNYPNFYNEWGEAERYINHPNPDKKIQWTKEEWLEKVKNGKVMRFSEIENLQNITDTEEFEYLLPEKLERFFTAWAKKEFELPIAVKFPNEIIELVSGNTRVTGLRNKGYNPKIWVFEL